MIRGPGTIEGYEWLSRERSLWDLSDLITRHFTGRFLLIVCFDSSRITPTEEETRIGWRLVGGGMLSPPLTEHLNLPAESYYDWWIFEDARTAERFPVYDYFVNHGTWTSRSAEEIESSYDPTWERGRLELLRPLQELFWKMVGEYRPLAYVAVGAQLTITSRSHVSGRSESP